MSENRDLEEFLALDENVNKSGDSLKTSAYVGKRILPDLIEVAVSKGIKVLLTLNGYQLEGFYKGGPIRIESDADDILYAIDRKERKLRISDFDDLVKLNYEWWKASRDKKADWVNPGKEWIEEFGRLNLVKRQVMFIPGDD